MPILICFGRCWGLDEKLATQTLKGLSFLSSENPFVIFYLLMANFELFARIDTSPEASDYARKISSVHRGYLLALQVG